MLLITGAGGKTGRTLIRTLSAVESVCAFVYRQEYVSIVKSLGAEKAIVGDMQDDATIHSAMQGADAVYHICPNMSPEEIAIGESVIDAARINGVKHFIYHSVLHSQTEKMAHHWQKLRVEEMIFESGLPFTILQPAPYMQNLLANWNSIASEGILRVPYSISSKFSFVDLEDVAEGAKIVLMEPGHLNAIYELAGTEPMSHAEVAEIFGLMLKHDVRAEKEELGDWRARAEQSERSSQEQSKRAEYALENLVRMFEYYDRWGLVGNPNVLRWLLKREPNSVGSFIERSLNERDNI